MVKLTDSTSTDNRAASDSCSGLTRPEDQSLGSPFSPFASWEPADSNCLSFHFSQDSHGNQQTQTAYPFTSVRAVMGTSRLKQLILSLQSGQSWEPADSNSLSFHFSQDSHGNQQTQTAYPFTSVRTVMGTNRLKLLILSLQSGQSWEPADSNCLSFHFSQGSHGNQQTQTAYPFTSVRAVMGTNRLKQLILSLQSGQSWEPTDSNCLSFHFSQGSHGNQQTQTAYPFTSVRAVMGTNRLKQLILSLQSGQSWEPADSNCLSFHFSQGSHGNQQTQTAYPFTSVRTVLGTNRLKLLILSLQSGQSWEPADSNCLSFHFSQDSHGNQQTQTAYPFTSVRTVLGTNRLKLLILSLQSGQSWEPTDSNCLSFHFSQDSHGNQQTQTAYPFTSVRTVLGTSRLKLLILSLQSGQSWEPADSNCLSFHFSQDSLGNQQTQTAYPFTSVRTVMGTNRLKLLILSLQSGQSWEPTDSNCLSFHFSQGSQKSALLLFGNQQTQTAYPFTSVRLLLFVVLLSKKHPNTDHNKDIFFM